MNIGDLVYLKSSQATGLIIYVWRGNPRNRPLYGVLFNDSVYRYNVDRLEQIRDETNNMTQGE